MSAWSIRTATVTFFVIVGSLAAMAALAPALSAATDQAYAQGICEDALPELAENYGPISSVRRAENDDVAGIAEWQEARLAPDFKFRSPLRDVAPGARWTVCVFEGSFNTPTAPRPDGSFRGAHNMITVFITPGGETVFDSAGYAGSVDPETPADLSAQSLDPVRQ